MRGFKEESERMKKMTIVAVKDSAGGSLLTP